ncbi:FAD binding domain-containing protein [Aestuariivirga sp.]|uniref:FAD binding domain-containing protein n=1 Tax=Aestuariivirga sp. TaxID=2650926 RepID=UPI0039E63EAB
MPVAVKTVRNASEAKAALSSPDSVYLGGGTLVLRNFNDGDVSKSLIVRLADGLSDIIIADGAVTLGASVTMAEVIARHELHDLAAAAKAVGGPAVRNMATVGGNLFAPVPYGDFAAALLALDAVVVMCDGELPIGDFLARRATLRDVVTAVRFHLPPAGAFKFLKVTRVKPKGTSVITIAAVAPRDAKNIVRGARIALTCMGDAPMRAIAAEAAFEGQLLSSATVGKAAEAIGDGTSPITDPVASAWYRKEVLPVHFRRLMTSYL